MKTRYDLINDAVNNHGGKVFRIYANGRGDYGNTSKQYVQYKVEMLFRKANFNEVAICEEINQDPRVQRAYISDNGNGYLRVNFFETARQERIRLKG